MSKRVWTETTLVSLLNMKRLSIEGKNRLCFGSRFSCRKVVLEYGARINGPAYFRGTGTVTVGRYAAIGQELRVLTSNHDVSGLNMNVYLQNSLKASSNHGEGKALTIGPATWIGDGVTIVGADVGVGAIIGAGSVVTKNVEPFSIVAGNPAKLIRHRFSEKIISKIMETEWWSHSVDDLKPCSHIFSKKVDDIDGEDYLCLKRI